MFEVKINKGVVTGPILFAMHEMKDDPNKQRELQTLFKICNLEEKLEFDIKEG